MAHFHEQRQASRHAGGGGPRSGQRSQTRETKTARAKASALFEQQQQQLQQNGNQQFGSQSYDAEFAKNSCGTYRLTTRDFWKHCDNEGLASLIRGTFNSVTVENFGIQNHPTSGTEGFANLLSRWLMYTYGWFALNGRRGLEQSKAPQEIQRGFFCDEEKFQEILVRVLPEQMDSMWAAADRTGAPWLRFDTLAQQHALSVLALPDLKFFYRGCSYQGLNTCQWASVPDDFWPEHIEPSSTVAELLNRPLMEIAQQPYNVDLRALVGVTGLAQFAGVTLTIRQMLTAPYPADQVGEESPWLCAVWFMLQQYVTAVLNSSVCKMNYRFTTAFLVGGAAFSFLRWFSEMLHCLNLGTGLPIDTPTLTSALSRVMNFICSLQRENNRGGFTFRLCDVTTTPEPSDCNRDCYPLCSEIGDSVNDSTASNNGDGICQCATCCTIPCPPPCPEPPCPPPSGCDSCPTTSAPTCFPKIGELVAAFIQYAYVVESPSSTSGDSGSSVSGSSVSSTPSPLGLRSAASSSSKDKKDGKDREKEEKEEKDDKKESGSGAVSARGIFGGSGGGGGSVGVSGRLSLDMLRKWELSLEEIFASVKAIKGTGKSSRLLAQLYLKLFASVQPTDVLTSLYGVNQASFIEALSCEIEPILRYTLGGKESSLIRLNHSPVKIPKTAFTSLTGAMNPAQLRALFVSCTNDTKTGERFDYCSMIESFIKLNETDFWAYYRGKRLEGFSPCQWSRLNRCYWSVDPDMTLQTLLSHPGMHIFQFPYLLDLRSFVGIPGLLAFSNVTLTLRQVMGSESPIIGDDYLSFIWNFVIQEGLAAYLNASLGCIFYRFATYGGFPFVILRFFSDAVWALNTQNLPQPPIDTPFLTASLSRLLVVLESVAHENRRGVKHWRKFGYDPASQCTRRTGCSCKSTCVQSPDVLALADSFTRFMTVESA